MVTRVHKWGNSQGLRLPLSVLREADIDVGQPVDVTVEDGRIVIRPARSERGKHSLKKLIARLPKRRRQREVNWGPPVGKEAW